MAAFSIKCPHCGTVLEVQDEWVNMETACPICNNQFIIPCRPLVNPMSVKRELKLPPQTSPVVSEMGGDGLQTPPYFEPPANQMFHTEEVYNQQYRRSKPRRSSSAKSLSGLDQLSLNVSIVL